LVFSGKSSRTDAREGRTPGLAVEVAAIHFGMQLGNMTKNTEKLANLLLEMAGYPSRSNRARCRGPKIEDHIARGTSGAYDALATHLPRFNVAAVISSRKHLDLAAIKHDKPPSQKQAND
jgi:hypothetical protein